MVRLDSFDEYPNRPAVSCGDVTYTYGDLGRFANRVAQHLSQLGVTPGDRVAVKARRRAEVPAAILGIRMVGGVYVPVSPDLPAERVAQMYGLVAPVVTISDDDLDYLASSGPSDLNSNRRDPVLALARGASEIAYLIFTSGTTGMPKAVSVSQNALSLRLRSLQRRLGIEVSDVWLGVAAPSFDMSIADFLLPLSVGAHLVVADDVTIRSGGHLAVVIEQMGVTVVQATPTTWTMLLDAPEFHGVPLALSGGERITSNLASRILKLGSRLHNLYGPTEAAVWATTYEITGDEGHSVPVGKVLDDTHVVILDNQEAPVLAGVQGDVYISGPCLAEGYYGDDDLTSRSFREDLASVPGRWYKTGDLGFVNTAGELVISGRADDQVKLRGYRVELGEVATHLSEVSGAPDARVIVRHERSSDPQLVGYIYLPAGIPWDERDVLAQLRKRLPVFMVPSRIVRVVGWPTSTAGKIDVGRLPAPPLIRDNRGGAVSSPIERAVVSAFQRAFPQNEVGVESDFFLLGGDSMSAVSVARAIGANLGVEMSAGDVLANPNPRALAARASGAKQRQSGAERPRRVGHAGPLPVLPEQKLRLARERWFTSQDDAQRGHNVSMAWRLDTVPAIHDIRAALRWLTISHPALRAKFLPSETKGWHQEIGPIPNIHVVEVNCEDEDIPRVLQEQANLPFDLEAGVLVRASLITSGSGDVHLLLTWDHIVTDQVAVNLMLRELLSWTPQTPLAHDKYAEFVLEEADWLAREGVYAVEDQIEELRESSPRSPQNIHSRGMMTSRGLRLVREFVSEGSGLGNLRALGQVRGLSGAQTIMAGIVLSLARTLQAEHVPAMVVYANRDHHHPVTPVMDSANSLPAIFPAVASWTIGQVLDDSRERMLRLASYQRLPHSLMLERVSAESSRQPPTDIYVLVSFLEEDPGLVPFQAVGASGHRVPVGPNRAPAPILIAVRNEPEHLSITTTVEESMVGRDWLDPFMKNLETVMGRLGELDIDSLDDVVVDSLLR